MAILEAEYYYRRRVNRRQAMGQTQLPPQWQRRRWKQSHESSLREQSRLFQRRLRATLPLTVYPPLLTRQYHGLPPHPSRASTPVEALKSIPQEPETPVLLPDPSPYVARGRGYAHVGGLGFSIKFARRQLGKGEKKEELLVYEPEPMEPLFGLDEHLDLLPSPELEAQPELELMDWINLIPLEPWEGCELIA
ncbi:hypothetical protein EDB81DRAFT_945738 [Dactylonectria macrodidyma]|uniref:Uncharacterized protein n=1 Tax=Dactylonectria macrodidyma TaxID=307937 RepID=A0A9P9F5Q1_9HYPO|nr:hypothetical protein EDB81DRAFT_945738 [Dactylonectria macrodidyma]